MFKQEPFTSYLSEQEKLSNSTISEHIKTMNRFILWAKEQAITDISHVTYTELLEYIKYCKSKGMKTQSINTNLNTLKKYYHYLKHIGLIEKNPTKKLILKGQEKTITQNVLTYTELEQLYKSYLALTPTITNNPKTPHTKQKNNVLLGLMLWQGLVSGDIAQLTLEHIYLADGVMYVPKKGQGSGRKLSLLPNQVFYLNNYINEHRVHLNPKYNELIPGSVHTLVHSLFKELKAINPKVNNTVQLRTSIIIHWLKVYDKRQTQYMAGFKSIGSIEKYQLQEMDSLTDTLLRHHPFA